ncbi:MAG: T9SS type A sorting domain-containing protein [Bacteroidetes bacterium]|nr:T9SS type A sorting domain-containing protein [Bacteroidota bacterium]
MKKRLLALAAIAALTTAKSQTVPIYIYFASHNEMDDVTYHGLNYSNPVDFATMKTYVQKACDTISYYQATYEMMLESNFILATLSNDNAYLSSTDIIEWADNQPNIEVQSHNHFAPTDVPPNPYNSTDLVYLLDSCGVDTAYVLGGFIWKDFTSPAVAPEDWTQWQTPQPGAVFANAPFWQPTLLWGGGSPMHVNDYEAYGIWRPTDATDAGFGTHNEFGTLVNFGTGCGQDFVIDDTTDATLFAYRVMNFVDSLHTHYDGNPDAFFNMKIMFNFRYLPESGYIDKIGTVLNLIKPYILDGRMEYKGIMDIYSEWQTLHPLNSESFISQCDTTAIISNAEPTELSIPDNATADSFTVYPNPTDGLVNLVFNDTEIHQWIVTDLTGRIVMQNSAQGMSQLDLSTFQKGTYLLFVDQQTAKRIVVQ